VIEAFRLTRFRGFEDTNWIYLRPLTLFFGHNSSGKSSLLAGLLMLRQSVLNPDRSTPFVFTSDLGVDLGSYEDLIFGHRYYPRRPLSVSLRLRLNEPFVNLGRRIDEVLLRLQIGYDKPRKVTYLLAAGIFDTEGRRFLEVVRQHSRRRPISEWQLMSDLFLPPELPTSGEITWSHFLPLPVAGSEAYKSVSELCQQVAQQVEADFRSISYIGPLRTEPERVYYFTGESVSEVGRRGENTFKLLAAVQYGGRIEELKHYLNWWLERLGYQLDVQVLKNTPLLQIVLEDKDSEGREQVYNLKDVGFGLSQVLPVLVQCYAGDRGRTILLEQPELHLHPRAQADMGDLLIDALDRGHRFLIETHSEHLLLRLRRRIAETTVKLGSMVARKLQHDQLSVCFVERQDGKSLVKDVAVNEIGQISQPPEGFRRFFSDDYDEMMVIAEMASAHAKKAHGA
jgi:predicted ATPase